MKLVWSTGDFVLAGVPVQGFPLLLTRDGQLEFVVHLFLIDTLIERGRNTSYATWRFYGYAMFGFFEFLEEAGRKWHEPRMLGRPSVVASYRAYFSKRAKRSSVNGRLVAIVRFFEFAKANRLIDELPFNYKEATEAHSPGTRGLLAPPYGSQGRQVDGLRMRPERKLIRVLSASQCERFLSQLNNKTHHLMAQLQLSTGIRVDELVSLPADSILDPRTEPKVRAFFVVVLDPKTMRTKGSVKRTIHVPRSLMALLWAYKSVDRSLRLKQAATSFRELFISERGRPYLTRSIWSIYQDASSAMEVHVHPHMLRHTYATHTLRCLVAKLNTGNALLYVRNRLGHSSVSSTEIYLHYVDDLVVTVMDEFQRELSALAQAKEGG